MIDPIASAGYYVALRVGFAFPEAELNALPKSWVEHYTLHGLVVSDPIVKWAYYNLGVSRLSELDLPDPQKVLSRAHEHGLRFGAVISVMSPNDQGRRSYGFFFHGERELSEQELHQLQGILHAAHFARDGSRSLTAAEIEALRMQAKGMRLKEIASALGISQSAVKARLNNAKSKLGAKTLSQALSIASSRRVI
jgi:LuxR family transcriptional regulator